MPNKNVHDGCGWMDRGREGWKNQARGLLRNSKVFVSMAASLPRARALRQASLGLNLKSATHFSRTFGPVASPSSSSSSFFNIYLFIFGERGREGEREGEKYQCERETLTGCLFHAPHPGAEPTTRACALTGNQTSDISLCRMTSSQLSHTGQGFFFL